MTSRTVPIYRHGRKFYVSAEEYARVRSEERRFRQVAVQRSQHLPVPKVKQSSMRLTSASSNNSIQRNNSNPLEVKRGILKKPSIPTNSLINTYIQSGSNRMSRSVFRSPDEQNIPLLTTPTISQRTPLTTIRSSSFDKILDTRRTPLSLLSPDNDIIRSFSDEILQSPQQSPILSRRPVAPIGSDYGKSPITTFSMTSADQTYKQTNPSSLTEYLTRIKQSSLNPSSQSLPSTSAGVGTIFETNVQGANHGYTVFGTSNRRNETGVSSFLTRSTSDTNKSKLYQQNTASDSFSDDNPSSVFTLTQRRKGDVIRYPTQDSVGETDDDFSQQRELWTRSTYRSQSSDGFTEKKRVRFADNDNLTLQAKTDNDKMPMLLINQPSTRRQNANIVTDSRGRPRPFYTSFQQATSKIDRIKLATDV